MLAIGPKYFSRILASIVRVFDVGPIMDILFRIEPIRMVSIFPCYVLYIKHIRNEYSIRTGHS